MHRKQLTRVVGIVFLGLFLSACDQQKIADINADPGRFHGKEVNVAGRVTQSIGVLGRGIYQIDDGSDQQNQRERHEELMKGRIDPGVILKRLWFVGHDLCIILENMSSSALQRASVNRQFVLASRPVGLPRDSDFRHFRTAGLRVLPD